MSINKEKIQIGIPCGFNSERYTKHLIDSIEKTASGQHEIEYLIGVNHVGVKLPLLEELLNEKKLKYSNNILVSDDKVSWDHAHGSNNWISSGHGRCADMLMDSMSHKYGAIVDSDCAFLMKDWDIEMVSMIDDKTIILGSEYGHDDKKYMRNANVIVCLFDVEKMKEINLSWKPELKHVTIDEENRHIYNREIGETIFLDTGSQLPKKLYEYGLSSKYMKLVSPRVNETAGDMIFMTNEIRGEEYHLNGKPVATHLGRSTSRPYDGAIAKRWRTRVDEWLKNI
tara:strand:- start:1729 stop:2580 length:852 start_codon:yes stop_codon:yes gene_type:complete